MPRSPDDIPITSASYRVRGDIYSDLSDSNQVRIIDSSAQGLTFGSSSNAAGTAINPATGVALPAGFDSGVGEVIADYVAMGLYNASWWLGPNDTGLPISETNPLPYWSVGGTATSPISWTRQGGSTQAYFLQAYSDGVTLNDDVYVEQYVPVRGFTGNDAVWARISANGGACGGAILGSSNVLVYVNVTFFNSAGVQTGSTRELTRDIPTLVGGTGGDQDLTVAWDGSNLSSRFIPGDAAFVRFRCGVRATATVAGVLQLYILSSRLMRSTDAIVVSSPATLTNSVAGLRWNGTRLSFESIAHNNLTNAMYPWSPVIVTMPFTFNALAGTASNLMQPWDNAVNQGTPYIDMPYRGTVIGLSYRISGSPTAGTFNVRARTGGGAFLLSTGALGTAAALTDSVKQNINTAAGQFTASTAIGVQVTTSGLTPTTLNISVLMYVALDVSQI